MAVGFGVKDPAYASVIGETADGVVVGSALVEAIWRATSEGRSQGETVASAAAFVRSLADACKRKTPEGVQ